jgi:protein-S-isoprenylcysteine O-methyltransferase Ste14
MTNPSSSPQSPEKFQFTPGVIRRFIQLGVLIVLQAILLFTSAGRLDWLAGWLYLALYVGFIGLNAMLLIPKGSALIEERSRLEIPKRWDRVVMAFYGLSGPAMLVVAGLNRRWGWTADLGRPIQLAALAIMAIGLGLFSWAMSTNAYFSAMVRIQEDREHQVVSTGPYWFVRHPGYTGVIIFSLATPPMLDALWAFIPAVVLVITTIIRTWFEDRTLHAELEGYPEYAGRVRYRLVPGIW